MGRIATSDTSVDQPERTGLGHGGGRGRRVEVVVGIEAGWRRGGRGRRSRAKNLKLKMTGNKGGRERRVG